MAVVIGAGVYGGIKLDEQSGNEKPLYTIFLSLLAVGLAIYLVIKDLMR